MKSKLVAGDQAIKDFVLEVFEIDDPIICVWSTPGCTHPDEHEIEYEKAHVDNFKFFSKEQLYSFFFPDGVKKGQWNLVLISVKQKSGDPFILPNNGIVQGWMMGVDLDKISVDFDL